MINWLIEISIKAKVEKSAHGKVYERRREISTERFAVFPTSSCVREIGCGGINSESVTRCKYTREDGNGGGSPAGEKHVSDLREESVFQFTKLHGTPCMSIKEGWAL